MKYFGNNALDGLVGELEAGFAKKADIVSYSIKKQVTAEEGYASSYRLMADGVPVGDAINILKDMFLKSAEIKTAQAENVPSEGCKAGEKYIDLLVGTEDGGGTGTHLYLLLKDMVKPVSAGDGIALSDENAVSVKTDPASANGLSVSENGLSLAEATPESAGAMSAADKAKLDGLELEEITAEEVRALFHASGTAGEQQ